MQQPAAYQTLWHFAHTAELLGKAHVQSAKRGSEHGTLCHDVRAVVEQHALRPFQVEFYVRRL
jgi:hypothetical protein